MLRGNKRAAPNEVDTVHTKLDLRTTRFKDLLTRFKEQSPAPLIVYYIPTLDLRTKNFHNLQFFGNFLIFCDFEDISPIFTVLIKIFFKNWIFKQGWVRPLFSWCGLGACSFGMGQAQVTGNLQGSISGKNSGPRVKFRVGLCPNPALFSSNFKCNAQVD